MNGPAVLSFRTHPKQARGHGMAPNTRSQTRDFLHSPCLHSNRTISARHSSTPRARTGNTAALNCQFPPASRRRRSAGTARPHGARPPVPRMLASSQQMPIRPICSRANNAPALPYGSPTPPAHQSPLPHAAPRRAPTDVRSRSRQRIKRLPEPSVHAACHLHPHL